jgi:hypothetical protein
MTGNPPEARQSPECVRARFRPRDMDHAGGDASAKGVAADRSRLPSLM